MKFIENAKSNHRMGKQYKNLNLRKILAIFHFINCLSIVTLNIKYTHLTLFANSLVKQCTQKRQLVVVVIAMQAGRKRCIVVGTGHLDIVIGPIFAIVQLHSHTLRGAQRLIGNLLGVQQKKRRQTMNVR